MATTSLDTELLVRRPSGRPLYTWAAVVAALVVFAGFSRTFYLNGYFAKHALTALQIVHGTVMTLWFTIFFVQVRLVASGRTPIHRRLGTYGAVLALLVVLVGTTTAIVATKAGRAPPGPPPLVFLAVPLGDMVVFATLVGAALRMRRRTEYHKRLMLLGSLGILTAAIARIPIDALQAAGLPAFFLVTDVLLLAFAAFDTIRHRRLHPVFAWGIGFIVLTQVGRFLIAGTPQWMAFAKWLTG